MLSNIVDDMASLLVDNVNLVLTWCTPKFIERFKCESKGENNGKRKSWGTLFSSQHFEGKKSVMELRDGD